MSLSILKFPASQTTNSGVDDASMCILIVCIGIFHGIEICVLLKKVKRSGKEVRIN
jgi:hypothetical protein